MAPLLALLLAATPQVAVLSTPPGTAATELRWQPLGQRGPVKACASFAHLEDATALGAVVPGTLRVVATATTIPSRDASFASTLFALEPGKPARALVGQVAVSTRPLVSAGGRIFVQRGVAGPEPEGAQSGGRVDALSVDEVDWATGRVRPVLRAQGYALFLAGMAGSELLVYRVDPAGAALLAVHQDSLGVRELIPAMTPLARDFAVDPSGQQLAFTQGDPETGRWHVETVDLKSLERGRVGPEHAQLALLPTYLGPSLGLLAAQGAPLATAQGQVLLAPQGPGFSRVRAVTRARIAVGLDERPGDFPTVFAVALDSGAAVSLPVPSGARLELAGVHE